MQQVSDEDDKDVSLPRSKSNSAVMDYIRKDTFFQENQFEINQDEDKEVQIDKINQIHEENSLLNLSK